MMTKPPTKSLLNKLWPAIQSTIDERLATSQPDLKITNPDSSAPRVIKRLTLDWQNPVTENRLTDSINRHQEHPSFQLSRNNPKFIGILVHQILQHIAQWGIEWWQAQYPEQIHTYLQNHLLQLGMLPSAIPEAIS